ncbi:MAG: ABC transporter ATP-binding protein [Coriobacteriia bacterium]|nr:ABC transporter ATP-binding protein [Coriobacteriia bacterium]
MLAFEHAALGYGETPVLSGVTLEVAPGTFLGLVGPNGAGKSTLLRAVCGEAAVLGGRVRLDGRDVRALGPRERARLVGVVPQSLPPAFPFAGREFVAMGRHPWTRRFSHETVEDEDAVTEAMTATDTARLAVQAVDTLSGGDLQRLTLAQALAQRSRALLLDEPTSHLDLNHRLQVLDLVRARASAGMAVAAVFHDLDLAARYADVIGVVAEGRLLALGGPADVLTSENVSRVFGVRSVIGRDAVTGSVTVTPVVREEEAAPARAERLFVAGGSGAAAPLLRRLALAGYRVSAGALNEGDVDHGVAVALGLPIVELPPFGEIGPAQRARLDAMASEADACLVAPAPFGRGNLPNLLASLGAGRPVLFVGGWERGRDFAGGEADAAAREALSAGALQVADVDQALSALAEVLCGGPG